ncbi:hypothetical protein [Streptomyces sp. NBC_01500]|uniref:hypothetical protein n=1 Tax=Streptomyces sp. NBC_01500 TaxID=2903886 RepID=UPI00225197F1|nr:hypothetical protein [Streptomyces sp. NBC_01500]MCX4554220.1 hypothetical protein [Streptomyces sp. NBC_01500]
MAKQTVTVNGRTLVSRTWMRETTGAGASTIRLWYATRLEQPEKSRFPEKSFTEGRTDYYDQEQFEAFYREHQQHKKESVLPTAPSLYDGAPDDLLSINEAAQVFHFSDASVIRRYLSKNPGYFPASTATVEGPSGRQIPAFRRADLQEFDRKRDGDNSGAAGNPGTPRAKGHTPEVQQRVEQAVTFLRETGGYRRGSATALANHHGEPAWKWYGAVREARALLGDELGGV